FERLKRSLQFSPERRKAAFWAEIPVSSYHPTTDGFRQTVFPCTQRAFGLKLLLIKILISHLNKSSSLNTDARKSPQRLPPLFSILSSHHSRRRVIRQPRY